MAGVAAIVLTGYVLWKNWPSGDTDDKKDENE